MFRRIKSLRDLHNEEYGKVNSFAFVFDGKFMKTLKPLSWLAIKGTKTASVH